MKSLLINSCLLVFIFCQSFCLASESIPAPAPQSVNGNPLTGQIDTASSAQYHYPPPTFKISGLLGRLVQKCTGLTYVSEVSTDFIAQRILKKKFGGKVKVKVRTYSFTDLLRLKVRIATVHMTGCHYKNIPLGDVEIESKTPFWLLLGPHKRPSMQRSALLGFKMKISEHDLDQILHCERVTNVLRLFKLDLSSLGPGLDDQKLQMHQPEVRLDDNLIVLKAGFATPNADPSTASQLTLSGEPKLHGDDRIFLEHVKVESPDISEPEKFSIFIEHLINPLVNLGRFDRPNFAMRLDEIVVKSKQLLVRGRIIVSPPQPQTLLPGSIGLGK